MKNPARRKLATILIALVTLLVVLPISLVAIYAKALRDSIHSPNANVTSRVEAARPLLAYAPPVDPSITPAAAGSALWAMQSILSPQLNTYYPQRESAPHVPLPLLTAADAPFQDILSIESKLPDPAKVIARARRGFSPAELAWLRELARHPVWAQVAIVARAPAIDAISGRMVLPLPEGAVPHVMPNIRFSEIRQVAIANASRVALLLSEGRRAEAEHAVAEPFGLARALADGTYLIDVLIGATLVRGSPRNALEAYYQATNDPRLSALPSAEVPPRPAETTSSTLAERIAIIRDPARVTAERLEMLPVLAINECESVRGIFFGRSSDVTATFAYARDSVARTDGEREYVRITETLPGTAAHDFGPGGLPLTGRILNFAGRVTGNDRMRGCPHILGMT